ncbi:hypothetical protein LBMAG42_43660 [Deltaproteobacteria bacterium]|nr:hypothetical protein LBMAG42_43660 [Deltaproteobacteria bacterium]
MLTWTPAGAVERPRALQIRLQRSYPGRVRAGAPVPTRSMPTEDVRANLEWFTTASTRGRPVESVVFSGVGAASRPDLAELCAFARERGIGRVTLHAGVEDLPALGGAPLPVDTLVLPLQVGESGSNLAAAARVLAAARDIGLATVANTQIVASALPSLEGAARVARATGVRSMTFTYPFPIDGAASGEAPPPARVLASLRLVIPGLVAAGVAVAIRGLPACLLDEFAPLAGKTGNRWYVDADHQRDKALLFFPDVAAFHKSDECRFCSLNERCDGWFATYLRRPAYGRLRAIEATSAR